MNLTQIYALFKTKTFNYLFLFETNVYYLFCNIAICHALPKDIHFMHGIHKYMGS